MSLRLEIDEELERKFREIAMQEFGYGKGSLRKASESAISNWIREKGSRKPSKKVKDPVKLIEGGLSNYRGKSSSVGLQHESTRIWAKKAD